MPDMNLSATSSHRSVTKGAVAAALSLFSLYGVFCVLSTPHILGSVGYVTHFPLSPAAGSGGPRPEHRRTRAVLANRGDCGTRFLVGSLARRPQAAELWGGVTYYAANRPRAPPEGAPKRLLWGGGAPPPQRADHGPRGVMAAPAGTGQGRPLAAVHFSLAAAPAGVVHGGGVPLTVLG